MSAKRLNSQLSFHVAFAFPASLESLARLRTAGSQWRTLGDSSLGSLRIDEVDISTANTLIEFQRLQAGRVQLVTINGPIKVRLGFHPVAFEPLRSAWCNALPTHHHVLTA